VCTALALNGGVQVLMVAVYCKNNTKRVITFRGQSVKFSDLQHAVGTIFRSKFLSSGASIADISEWKVPLRRPRRRWEDNIKIYLLG
jgi:hypothetical protein